MESSQTGAMGRREFIGAAAAALFAGVVITVTGCGEDDTTSPSEGSVAGLVEAAPDGHKHSVSISKVQIDAGAAVTLTFSGGDHTHTVSLTAADVAKIKSGAGVHDATSSTTNGHSHKLMFM